MPTITLTRPTTELPRKFRSENEEVVRNEFKRLADEWHDATDHLSSPTRKMMHPAYQRIISKGAGMIPFILEDLKRRGGDWYFALGVISGENPAPDNAAGNVRLIKNSWLEWGSRKGYIN
jgi:hypothetical protein